MYRLNLEAEGDFENYVTANDLKSLKKRIYEQVKNKRIKMISTNDANKLKEAG